MLVPVDIVFDSIQIGTENVTGTTDNPQFNLRPSLEDVVGVSVLYASVPFTYYVIDTTNNKFRVNLGSGTAPPLFSTICEIVPGTYNATNIVLQLEDAIKRTDLAVLNPGSGTMWKFFIDDTTSKLVTYLSGGNSGLFGWFELDFTVTGSANEVLGFAAQKYRSITGDFRDNTETVISNAKHLFAPKVVNLSGPNQMYLGSSLAATLHGSVRNHASQSQLLGFWPITENYQGIIDVMRETPPMMYFGQKTSVSNVSFELTIGNRQNYTHFDNAGAATVRTHLSLNGEPYQVALRFYKEVSDESKNQTHSGNTSTLSIPSQSNQNFAPKSGGQLARDMKQQRR
jgi:hypothetical protein